MKYKQELIERYKRNLKIYEITLEGLKRKEPYNKFSYAGCVDVDFSKEMPYINYRINISNLRIVIARLKYFLRDTGIGIKDSWRITERREILEKHLKGLRKLREKRYAIEQLNEGGGKNE